MKKEYEDGLKEVACAVWEHPEPGFQVLRPTTTLRRTLVF